MPYDASGALAVGANPFASSGVSPLAQTLSKFPTFEGSGPDPEWVKNLPASWADFNKSNNVDDRRGDSFVTNWGGALKADLLDRGVSLDDLKLMLKHPMTPWKDIQAQQPMDTPVTPIGVQAGILDIIPGHQAWIARKLAAEQSSIQRDPNIHSFDEPLDPNSPPVALDRRKSAPFGSLAELFQK